MIPIEGVLDKYGVEYNPDKDRNQQVRCVFHDDSHASASVNLGSGVFNCFTCSVAGDAIELLMSQEGIEFREAKRQAEELAESHGAPRRDDQQQAGRRGAMPSRSRPARRNWKSPWSKK